VFLFAAVGTKLCSRGPVLFRQARVGRDQQIFTMYKFRTFPVEHVDDRFSLDHRECPLAFGRFLRRTSIDELPQLFNVLRGEMSIVGPRPERPHFADRFAATVPGYADRHRVRPGLTGLAVVHGLRGDTSIPLRAHYDNRYIDTWTLTQDLTIIVRTVRHLATGS
jgi:lipopolysaccharide/colanic/teichoic acid biosynthesis glycosyltransferase